VSNYRTTLRWPGSVKTRFAFHIELGYTIVDLNIRYFAIHEYMVYVCGHRSASAVTDACVRSPNCPVRSLIRVCGHRTALCGHRSACAVTELPCEAQEGWYGSYRTRKFHSPSLSASGGMGPTAIESSIRSWPQWLQSNTTKPTARPWTWWDVG